MDFRTSILTTMVLVSSAGWSADLSDMVTVSPGADRVLSQTLAMNGNDIIAADVVEATGYVSATQLRVANDSTDTCSDGSPVGTFRINPADGHPEVCRPN